MATVRIRRQTIPMGRDALDRHRSLRVLVYLIIIVIAFYIINVVWNVLTDFGDILLLFFLAWVITFILEPVSSFLIGKRIAGRKIPRVLAVTLVYLALLVVISGAVVLAVPSIQAQVAHLAQELQKDLSGAQLTKMSAGAASMLERLGFSKHDANRLVTQLVTQIPAQIQDITNQLIASASGLLSTVSTVLFNASLVVIISFYMMLDGGRLIETMVTKLPPSWEPDIRLFQSYIMDIFGGFFRAQLIVAGIYMAMSWVILMIMRMPSGAFLAAFLGGLLMLLPFIGAFLAIVPPAALLALQTPPSDLLPRVIVLIVLLGAAQHVALNLIAPRVYGHHLGMDPILLFGAMLLGAKVGGVWGAFFAAPMVAILYAIFETFYDRFTSQHPLFRADEDMETDVAFEDAANHSGPERFAIHTRRTPAELDDATDEADATSVASGENSQSRSSWHEGSRNDPNATRPGAQLPRPYPASPTAVGRSSAGRDPRVED